MHFLYHPDLITHFQGQASQYLWCLHLVLHWGTWQLLWGWPLWATSQMCGWCTEKFKAPSPHFLGCV